MESAARLVSRFYAWVDEGEIPPKGFWLVDRDYRRHRNLFVVFPASLLVSVWLWLRNVLWMVESKFSNLSRRQHRKWYVEAYEHGFDEGRQAANDRWNQAIRAYRIERALWANDLRSADDAELRRQRDQCDDYALETEHRVQEWERKRKAKGYTG